MQAPAAVPAPVTSNPLMDPLGGLDYLVSSAFKAVGGGSKKKFGQLDREFYTDYFVFNYENSK